MLIDQNRLRHYSLACFVLLISAIFIGGEMPGAGSLFPAPWDKVVHVITFGTIGIFASLAWPTMTLPVILLVVLGLGASDEIHQLFIAGRTAGWDDLTADFLGGLAALPLALLLRRNFYRPDQGPN